MRRRNCVGALGRLELNCGAEWATERCGESAVVGESECVRRVDCWRVISGRRRS